MKIYDKLPDMKKWCFRTMEIGASALVVIGAMISAEYIKLDGALEEYQLQGALVALAGMIGYLFTAYLTTPSRSELMKLNRRIEELESILSESNKNN